MLQWGGGRLPTRSLQAPRSNLAQAPQPRWLPTWGLPPSPPPRQRGALHPPKVKVIPQNPHLQLLLKPPEEIRQKEAGETQKLPEQPAPGGALPACPLQATRRALHPLQGELPRCSCKRKRELSPSSMERSWGSEPERYSSSNLTPTSYQLKDCRPWTMSLSHHFLCCKWGERSASKDHHGDKTIRRIQQLECPYAASMPAGTCIYLLPSPISVALVMGKAVALMTSREPRTGGGGRSQKVSVQMAGVDYWSAEIPAGSHGTKQRSDCRNSSEHKVGGGVGSALPPLLQSILYHQGLSNTSDTEPPPWAPGETRMPH